MTIGEYMRKARNRAGVTMLELSKVAGVNYRTIYRAETDKSDTNIFTIICLADALGISIDEYIGREVPRCRKKSASIQ